MRRALLALRDRRKEMAFIRRLNRLDALKGECARQAAIAEYLRHPGAPGREQSYRDRHNALAAQFNAQRCFWMRRIVDI